MKIRLDQYLVQHGLIQSRERAKAMIMSGVVFVNEQKVDKAGEMIKALARSRLCTSPFCTRYWSNRIFTARFLLS